MSKRIAELEGQAKALLQEAKRLRQTNRIDILHILDADLESWRKKLLFTSQPVPAEWKLVFWSRKSGVCPVNHPTGTPFSLEQPWKTIAYASSPFDLIPALFLSAKRLQLFGFIYGILPTSVVLTQDVHYTACQYPFNIFGLHEVTFELDKLLDENAEMGGFFGEESFRNSAYIDQIYEEQQQTLELEKQYSLKVTNLERNLSGLQAEMAELEEAKLSIEAKLNETRQMAQLRKELMSYRS
jgi:hypothetical protein